MKKRTLVWIAAGIALVLAITVIAIVLSRQQLRRHRVFRDAGQVAEAPAAVPPVERWTETFASLAPEALAAILNRIEREHPDRYKAWSLGYLHARALIEDDEPEEAAGRLKPFLAANR